jgi:hypothetical protein
MVEQLLEQILGLLPFTMEQVINVDTDSEGVYVDVLDNDTVETYQIIVIKCETLKEEDEE